MDVEAGEQIHGTKSHKNVMFRSPETMLQLVPRTYPKLIQKDRSTVSCGDLSCRMTVYWKFRLQF